MYSIHYPVMLVVRVYGSVNIHAWVSASIFDDLGFLRPQNTDLPTEVRVFFVRLCVNYLGKKRHIGQKKWGYNEYNYIK